MLCGKWKPRGTLWWWLPISGMWRALRRWDCACCYMLEVTIQFSRHIRTWEASGEFPLLEHGRAPQCLWERGRCPKDGCLNVIHRFKLLDQLQYYMDGFPWDSAESLSSMLNVLFQHLWPFWISTSASSYQQICETRQIFCSVYKSSFAQPHPTRLMYNISHRFRHCDMSSSHGVPI